MLHHKLELENGILLIHGQVFISQVVVISGSTDNKSLSAAQ